MRLLTILSAVVLSGGMAMAQVGFSAQQQTSGVIGITSGQSARLNVVYPTVPAPILQVTCSATLAIADEQGGVLKSKDVQQLIAGRTVTLELSGDADLGGSSRVQIHAVTLTPNPGCGLVSTLEIIETATGKTTAVLESKVTFPNPQPPAVKSN